MDIITRILVTGTEGYLGSLLAPELIRQGYEVIGLDTGFYKERAFYRNGETTPLTIAKDLRHIEVQDLSGVDAVIHMAELSNDPAGQLSPNITYEINHKGSLRLAELARKRGDSVEVRPEVPQIVHFPMLAHSLVGGSSAS